jgi:ubiquinol-cytochrome c reductase cytochrome b subunit
VLIPSLAIPGLLFTGLALYPFLERWVTGDHAVHNLLDRPRDVPARTGIGAGGVVWFGVLLAGGGNDVIADKFDIPLYWTTWFFRITFILGPILAYLIAYRICLGLQRRDLALVEHGVETGIIVRSPNGEYTEAERHLRPEEAAPITDERPPPAIALAPPEHKGVQSRKSPLQWSKVRLTLNRHFIADAAKRPVPPDSHGNGREAQEPKAVKPPGH